MELEDYGNKRVLIIDDQKEIHNDFKEMLDPERHAASTDAMAAAFVDAEERLLLPEFEILHARSGEHAFEIVKAGRERGLPIAVAFVDIRMPPGIDGLQTIRRMREIDRDMELVIMTAYTDRSLPEIVHGIELIHKVLYIRKPFTREEVQQITLSLVGKWNIQQKLAEQRRQLAIEHQRLAAVLDATGDAMAMYDRAGCLVFANRACEKIFDLTESELKELPPDAIAERLRERFREPSLPELEETFLFEDGGTLVEEATAGEVPQQRLFHRTTVPVHDARGDDIGSLVVYRDVSKDFEMERMKAGVLRLRTELQTPHSFGDIIGASPPMRQVYALTMRAAESDITVLIQGESGTGKELVARSFHLHSSRKGGPFLAINCAAVPETLIESEMFGHERGAFTGATGRKPGAFERARGGTIFLDEVADMPLVLQSKLLRVLQEREVQRVGGAATIPVDVRVIAATNKDLEAAVKAGEFREDLFHRVAAFPIVVPPLRRRREDIPLLAKHFLKKHAERADRRIDGVSTATLRVLLQYDWPGNVRELENAIERAVLLETTDVLHAHNLPPHMSPVVPSESGQPEQGGVLPLTEVERQALSHALAVTGNNVTQAARALGINRATLHRKLRKYDLLDGS